MTQSNPKLFLRQKRFDGLQSSIQLIHFPPRSLNTSKPKGNDCKSDLKLKLTVYTLAHHDFISFQINFLSNCVTVHTHMAFYGLLRRQALMYVKLKLTYIWFLVWLPHFTFRLIKMFHEGFAFTLLIKRFKCFGFIIPTMFSLPNFFSVCGRSHSSLHGRGSADRHLSSTGRRRKSIPDRSGMSLYTYTQNKMDKDDSEQKCFY